MAFYTACPSACCFALNAATGDVLWRTDPEIQGAQRGLILVGERRKTDVFFIRLALCPIALDADDGSPIEEFGIDGLLGLRPPGPESYIGVTAPGVVFEGHDYAWLLDYRKCRCLSWIGARVQCR
ncbi:MAG: hypothetical protein CM1200mP9_03710 [Gammaproteobacteria bacterium]|nr:MAG: hypothetical protein CM1200mP9_03710 [Gammaproteobacteria bacterium]